MRRRKRAGRAEVRGSRAQVSRALESQVVAVEEERRAGEVQKALPGS
jgi:hypothetical protein